MVDVDRTYTLKLHRADRTVAHYEAQLYRVTDDGGLKLVAELPAGWHGYGISDVMEQLTDQLLVYENQHGELP